MKQVLLFLSVFCFTNSFFAQSLTPEVISPAGTSFTNGSNVLDWTLGEPVTATLTNSDILTQGFQQENLIVTSLDGIDLPAAVTIFPNPAVNTITVQFEKAIEKCTLELYSLEGKLVWTQTVYAATLSTVDMTEHAAGTYILKVQNTTTRSYQIIKSK